MLLLLWDGWCGSGKWPEPFRSSLALDHLPWRGRLFSGVRPWKAPHRVGSWPSLRGLRGLTLRELPLHCFAYFSISCSQKLAMRFQLYFSSTASRVATGYMASAAVPSVKLLQSLYFLFGFDMSWITKLNQKTAKCEKCNRKFTMCETEVNIGVILCKIVPHKRHTSN